MRGRVGKRRGRGTERVTRRGRRCVGRRKREITQRDLHVKVVVVS